LLLFVLFIPFGSRVKAVDDAILAVVGDELVTLRDLGEYMRNIYAQLKIEGRPEEEIRGIMADYEQKGINQLIDDRLILAAAEKAKVVIKPKAINDRMAEIQKRYPSQQDFISALLKEGMTISELRKKIEEQFKGQVMVEEEVRKKVFVNPREVTDYFNSNVSGKLSSPRYFLSSVFVSKAPDQVQARDKIIRVKSEIDAGLTFKDAVSRYSDLPSVGEIALDDIRPELKNKVIALAVEQVSDVIEVPEGYYIIKVEGRTSGAQPVLKTAKDTIYQQVFEKKFRERFKEWIESLRKKTYVEIKT
jgi:parvulin-like peptidyl-prolyl isomerase